MSGTSLPSILLVLPSFGIGGIELRTAKLTNALAGEFRFRILALDGNTAAAQYVSPPVNVEGWVGNSALKRNIPLQAIRFGRVLDLTQPDVLHTYNWGTFEWWLAARSRKDLRHIHGEDGFQEDETHGAKLHRRILRRILLRRCHKVVVPSQTLARTARNSWGLPSGVVEYIPNGVDVGRFQQPRSPDPDWVTLVCIASLSRVKNHLRLLRAFRDVCAARPLRLWIAGTGPENDSLVRFVRENALEHRVSFLGHRSDVAELLRKADCFCLSSDSEQMPVSVVEAMAAGCPVLSTDVGDVSEMVSKENRPFIVPRGQEQLYRARLEDLIDDASLRRRLGEANRAKGCIRYNAQDMIESYRQLYLRALQGHAGMASA